MSNGKRMIYLLSILLGMLTVIICVGGINVDRDEPIEFFVHSNGNVEKIKYWEDANGKWIVFVPTYADVYDIFFNVADGSVICIDNILIENNKRYECISFNTEYILSGKSNDSSIDGVIEFVKLGNVPTMYIDTQSGNLNYIHKEKGNKEADQFRVYQSNGVLDSFGSIESIKGRGNGTWLYYDKKPYNVTFMDEEDVLGMGIAKNWILLANAMDDSQMNNKVAYDLARSVGMKYVPECQWIDLYINGEYVGLYLFCERNEVHENRLNIPDSESFLVSKEAKTRLDDQGYPYIITDNNMALRIHHLSMPIDDLEQIWQSLEYAVFSTKEDVVNGKKWDEWIDLDSWVTRFLLDEVMGNGDGGFISQFFYGTKNEGKVYAGPIWDMDFCLNVSSWPGGYPNSIIANRDYYYEKNDRMIFYELSQKLEFWKYVLDKYKNVFLPEIEKLFAYKYQMYENTIFKSALANQIRWSGKDWIESVNEHKLFFRERIDFLNDYWLEKEEYCKVIVSPGDRVAGCIAIKKGGYLPEISSYGTNGWYYIGTDEYVDFNQPIYEDISIYHRETHEKVRQLQDISALWSESDTLREKYQDTVSKQRILPLVMLCIFFVFLVHVDVFRSKK